MFIVFEGLDGSGKSTQAAFLKDYLSFMTKKTVHCFRLPGSTEVGEKIRDLIFDRQRTTPLNPISEMLLFSAGHAQLVSEKIFPALQRNEIVILDRYTWSTLAYQVYTRGVNRHVTESVLNAATSHLVPDLTVFIKIDPELSLARKNSGSGNNNTFDHFELSLREQISQGYDYCIRTTDPSRCLVVNGNQDRDAIRILICNYIYTRFFSASA